MGQIAQTANVVYRDFETADPGSGSHKPIKSEIRSLFAQIETSIGGTSASAVSPLDFGGITDPNVDNALPLQAAINAVRASTIASGYSTYLNLLGLTWKTSLSLDAGGQRPPGLRIENGTIVGACAGKIVLDLSGTNSPVLSDLIVFGDKIATPAVGIYVGRDGSLAGCPNARFDHVETNGYFTKAGVINFAAEVFSAEQCRFQNKHRSTIAAGYVCVGHWSTIDSYLGGGITSDFRVLPSAASAVQSNILHWFGQTHILRPSDIALTIIGISKANPAVVSIAPADLAAANLANGDEVYLYDVQGMVELNSHSYTVAALNNVAGTLQLAGVDSTGFGTFTSGRLWNRTGPAMILNGAQMMAGRAGYLLCYGNYPVICDLRTGAIEAFDMEFQVEHQPPAAVKFRAPDSTTSAVLGFNLRLLKDQVRDAFFTAETAATGQVRIDNLDLFVAAQAAGPKVFQNAGLFRLQNWHIRVPQFAMMNDKTEFALWGAGVLEISDQQQDRFHYGPQTFRDNPTFRIDGSNQIVATFVSADDGAIQAPDVDLLRESTSPAANDLLGFLRFMGKDSAGGLTNTQYAGVRGQIVDPTSGAASGRVAFVTLVKGTPLEIVRADSNFVINTGIGPGGGFKHQHVAVAPIAGGASALVTVTWTTPFDDTNYTVAATVQNAVASVQSLSVVHVESVSTSGVSVRIRNDDPSVASGGFLHVIAIRQYVPA